MKIRLCTVALAAVILAAPSLAQQPSHPPVEAFGALPEMMNPSISPDGKHIATIQPYNGKPIARIFTLDPPGTPAVNMPIDEGFIKGVMWANNDRLLIRINVNEDIYHKGVDSWYRLVSADAHGQNFASMFSDRRESRGVNNDASIVSDLAVDDPDHIYMPLYNDFSGHENHTWSMSDLINAMFRVDVATGRSELVTRGGMDTQSWIMDGHGNVVARVDQTNNPRVDHLKIRQPNGSWKEIESAAASADSGLGVAGLTQDGKAIALTYYDKETTTEGLAYRGLNDDTAGSLFHDPHYDIDSILADPWTFLVIGVRVTADTPKDIYFDPKLQALQAGLEAGFPGASVHAVSWDLNQQKVIVVIDGPKLPPAYFFLDRETHKASPIRKLYSGISESDLGDVKPYPYKASDGLDIPAYLTLPPGKAPTKLPLVVFPHGGPMVRDDMSFNPEAQFFANRGYAVFQPNFRGSSGYGHKFQKAGYGQWGLKMQDDITDGVKKLIADGVVDPKRICIVGASYGGYAALAGAAFTPDLYACAAGWAGVYDVRGFLATRAKDYGRDSQMIESWQSFIGDRWSDSAKIDSVSPALNADKIKCPVLLMHGQDDTTVRIDQSETMERALRRAGKRVTFVAIPKETHNMEMANTRIRWLTELEKFLKENIGN